MSTSTGPMSQTRQAGENMRLDALLSLGRRAKAVEASRLNRGQKQAMIDDVVASADGHREESTRANFRSQCELVVRVALKEDIDAAHAFAQWRSAAHPILKRHSLVEDFLDVCREIAGRRGVGERSLASLVEDYTATDSTL